MPGRDEQPKREAPRIVNPQPVKQPPPAREHPAQAVKPQRPAETVKPQKNDTVRSSSGNRAESHRRPARETGNSAGGGSGSDVSGPGGKPTPSRDQTRRESNVRGGSTSDRPVADPPRPGANAQPAAEHQRESSASGGSGSSRSTRDATPRQGVLRHDQPHPPGHTSADSNRHAQERTQPPGSEQNRSVEPTFSENPHPTDPARHVEQNRSVDPTFSENPHPTDPARHVEQNRSVDPTQEFEGTPVSGDRPLYGPNSISRTQVFCVVENEAGDEPLLSTSEQSRMTDDQAQPPHLVYNQQASTLDIRGGTDEQRAAFFNALQRGWAQHQESQSAAGAQAAHVTPPRPSAASVDAAERARVDQQSLVGRASRAIRVTAGGVNGELWSGTFEVFAEPIAVMADAHTLLSRLDPTDRLARETPMASRTFGEAHARGERPLDTAAHLARSSLTSPITGPRELADGLARSMARAVQTDDWGPVEHQLPAILFMLEGARGEPHAAPPATAEAGGGLPRSTPATTLIEAPHTVAGEHPTTGSPTATVTRTETPAASLQPTQAQTNVAAPHAPVTAGTDLGNAQTVHPGGGTADLGNAPTQVQPGRPAGVAGGSASTGGSGGTGGGAPRRPTLQGPAGPPTVVRALSEAEGRVYRENLGHMQPERGGVSQPLGPGRYGEHYQAHRGQGSAPPHGFQSSDGSYVIPDPLHPPAGGGHGGAGTDGPGGPRNEPTRTLPGTGTPASERPTREVPTRTTDPGIGPTGPHTERPLATRTSDPSQGSTGDANQGGPGDDPNGDRPTTELPARDTNPDDPAETRDTTPNPTPNQTRSVAPDGGQLLTETQADKIRDDPSLSRDGQWAAYSDGPTYANAWQAAGGHGPAPSTGFRDPSGITHVWHPAGELGHGGSPQPPRAEPPLPTTAPPGGEILSRARADRFRNEPNTLTTHGYIDYPKGADYAAAWENAGGSGAPPMTGFRDRAGVYHVWHPPGEFGKPGSAQPGRPAPPAERVTLPDSHPPLHDTED